MALYTPFFQKTAQSVSEGYGAKRTGELMQSAYMGDPNALGELYQINPNAAMAIEQQGMKKQEFQQGQQDRRALMQQRQQESRISAEDRAREIAIENEGLIQETFQAMSKLPYEEAKQYGASVLQRVPQLQEAFDIEQYTPEMHAQVMQVNSDESGNTDLAKIEEDLRSGLLTESQAALLKEQILNPAPELKSDRDRRKADYAKNYPEWTEEKILSAVDSQVVTDPTTGVTSLFDPTTQQLTAIPVNYPETAGGRPEVAYEEGIYALADQAAGAVPFIGDAWGKIAGQFGADIPEDIAEARQVVRSSGQQLINAFRQNPRFAEGEAARLQQEINLLPSLLDSPASFRARARAIDTDLRRRIQNEEMVANNLRLPKERRDQAAVTVEAAEQYLNALQVPPKIEPTQLTDAATVMEMPREVIIRFVEDNRQSPEVIDGLPDDVSDAILEIVSGNR